MSTKHSWTDEDREECVSQVIDGLIAEMTFEEMRNLVWDTFYDDLIWQSWDDLLIYCEQYAPEFLENFEHSSKEEEDG